MNSMAQAGRLCAFAPPWFYMSMMMNRMARHGMALRWRRIVDETAAYKKNRPAKHMADVVFDSDAIFSSLLLRAFCGDDLPTRRQTQTDFNGSGCLSPAMYSGAWRLLRAFSRIFWRNGTVRAYGERSLRFVCHVNNHMARVYVHTAHTYAPRRKT